MTRVEIEQGIKQICEYLKKPRIPYIEKRLAREDIKDLRRMLEEGKYDDAAEEKAGTEEISQ